MYVPILKNRSVEVAVLRELLEIGLVKSYPLIEIVQQKVRSNAKRDFIDEIADLLKEKKSKILFVDIPKANLPNSTPVPIREFMTKANRNPQFSVSIMKELGGISGAVPVVSYNPDSFRAEDITWITEQLRSEFKVLAFRVESRTFASAFDLISSRQLIQKNDYFILDIGSASHINPAIKSVYNRIAQLKGKVGFTSIIINSPRSKNVTNIGMEDGEPILAIDNSLRDFYNDHKFDGFGDYAGISKELPTGGGSISPAGVYYSYNENVFVGFRRKRVLSEFEEYIAPSIIKSKYWHEYTPKHHKTCPGCQQISRINKGQEHGKSQAKWKGITMAHYVFAIDENLPSGL